MLRNNADAHRCLYFELGLPVINASEKTPQVKRGPFKSQSHQFSTLTIDPC